MKKSTLSLLITCFTFSSGIALAADVYSTTTTTTTTRSTPTPAPVVIKKVQTTTTTHTTVTKPIKKYTTKKSKIYKKVTKPATSVTVKTMIK